MAYEPKPGTAASWPGMGKKPRKIRCVAHRNIRAGEEFDVALWPNQYRKNEKDPDMTGKVSDKYVPPQQSGRMSRDEWTNAQNAPQDPDFDDSMPF